ncbi:ParB family chromosome partitioning protein [Sphingomonas leidyi]|jgi:ParB family chromosome partitioning protein|uniref:ParB family chromosome partitioning protein n=1 Tax=Sphingomonas leidyi TaxID=68569 RepID=A0A7X5V3Z5_9SPHN|nr:ParB/RepB/Spo0J family partition protein [Sphingomonas leidyi]MBN2974300.1 ParB/RepB/Spo0J family partition protein [Roseomonas aeriglobus]NIJ67343.1 ParB family chromosome partitioning protein [Sphingomonas leidyi]
MSRKNTGFAADLAAGIDLSEETPPPRRSGLASNVLTGRSNRLADLASGAIVNRTHELVDPARCRMWAGHNRDYALLTEERCADLIESIKAQGRQEMPAIVRRVSGDPDFDFEVICGARRHWSITWLRTHNYPDFKFLVDVREIGDEEAFRLADIENRARDDLTDLERARDYLRALDTYYDGRQKTMAERLKVSESWLTRYLDLARLPEELTRAFVNPQDLGIRNAMALKGLLKPEDRKARAYKEAARLSEAQAASGEALPVLDVIKALTLAVDPPKRSGSPKRSGKPETISSSTGKPVLRIEGADRKGIRLTLLSKGGASRQDAEEAIRAVLDQHWA